MPSRGGQWWIDFVHAWRVSTQSSASIATLAPIIIIAAHQDWPPRLCTCLGCTHLHPSSTTKIEARRTRSRKHRQRACKAWHHGPSECARKWVTYLWSSSDTHQLSCLLATWVRHSLQHPSVYIVRMSQVLLQNRLCLMTGKFGLHNRFCKDKMVAQLQVTINLYITNSIL